MLNNYSMADALDGLAPANHLFGCADLPQGWSYSTPPHMAHGRMRKWPLGRRLVGAMWALIGDPVQTLWAVRHAHNASVVWATTQAVAPALGLLRRLRILRAPLVVLVHNTASQPYTRFWLKGADAIVVFSPQIKNRLIGQGVCAKRLFVAEWGPDLNWAGYSTQSSEIVWDFMSTGKTYRDYDALLAAARDGKLDGQIFHGSDLISIEKGSTTTVANRPHLTNAEVIQALAHARVVVIPVADPKEPKGLTGITELADAVAIGKPVVMTENPMLPIDIDELGIGVSVPHDAGPELMLSAIRAAQTIDSDKVKVAATIWNERIFSQAVVKVFELVSARNAD